MAVIDDARGLAGRFAAWRDRSISNQITVAALTLTLAVASAIGVTTFAAVRSLVARNIASALEGQARLVEQRLASALELTAKDAAGLAENSFIANGLVDSAGRDTYLLPFLREHRHPGEGVTSLVLCDFKGTPIASSQPAAEGIVAQIRGVKRALATAKPLAEITSERGRVVLVYSHPVIFPPTGQVEGAIVELHDLGVMLAEASEFLGPDDAARLVVDGVPIVPEGRPRGRAEASVKVRPPLPPLLAGMEVTLEVGTRRPVYAPLRWVAVGFLLTGLVTLILVVRASRAMARRLAGPIEALSRVASEVASGGVPEVPAAAEGSAEVGTLTDAIAAMLGKLRAAQEELEQRVRERTAELQRRERELARYAETQVVLLREVNHRVKNNLSAIISVLHLEEARAGLQTQPELLGILVEMETRIRSLATVHALLSGAEWRPIPLSDLCRKLLRSSLGGAESAVELQVDGPAVLIESGQAHHLALVLNELATNTLKYGWAGDGPRRVEVAVRSDARRVELTYRDRGPGFPPPVLGLAPEAMGTGLQLVKGIVETSLGGELSLSNDGGAVASIRFTAAPPAGEGS